MRYRRKRLQLLKQKHIRIIIIVAAAVAVLWAATAILSATGRETKKQQATDALASTGVINIGLRGDLGALCTYNAQTGQFEGFEKDVADALASRIFGETVIVNHVEVSSRTKDALLREGGIDIAFAASIEKSTGGIVYTSPYFSDASAFLVNEGSMQTMTGLRRGTVAVVQGSLHAQKGSADGMTMMDDFLQLLRIDAVVKVYASYPEAVEALRAGFVDGVCASEIMLKLFGAKGMVILSERFMPSDYCVGVSEKRGAFSEAVDEAIDDMRRDGTLEALIGKWNLTNYAALDG